MGKGIRQSVGAHDLEPGSLSALIHQHVRAAIETAVHEELRASLGTSPYERNEVRRGYRNGIRERTLRLEQRLERAANPSGVAACQVRGDHGFIDLRHSPLIPRDDCRRPLFRAGAPEKGGPRQRENNRAGRPRQRPLSDAIAVAPSYFIALVRARPERGPQLLVHGGLDRSADVLVDQCAQRDGFKLMRSDRLADTLVQTRDTTRCPTSARLSLQPETIVESAHDPQVAADSDEITIRRGARAEAGRT